MPRQLAYLSAAPMVSTLPNAVLGGPRAHVLGVISGFEKLGWEVHRYIVGDRLKTGWHEQDNSPLLRSNWLMLAATDLARVLLGAMNGWRASRQIANADWAYERFASFQALGRWFKRRGIPWILETNGLMYVEATRDRKSMAFTALARSIEKRAYTDCDILVCSTQALKDTILAEVAGLDADKVLIGPNAVDVEFFDPRRYEPRRLFDGPTIGHVGNLENWQGLDTLIYAIADLRKEGCYYNLVAIGDGTMRAEWEKLAESLGVAEQVKFTGRVPRTEVPAYLAGFDLGYSGHVLMQTGSMYHSPVKLYEYMAMGMPIVASAFEDARTLVRDGDAGYLYTAGDVEDLKRILRTALAEHNRWQDMGRRGQARVLAEHSWAARIAAMVPRAEAILKEKYGTPYPARR